MGRNGFLVATDRRQRLAPQEPPSWPVRNGRHARRLHRDRHLRCRPARRRDEGLGDDRRDQYRPQRPDHGYRRLRDPRRPLRRRPRTYGRIPVDQRLR